MIPPFMAQANAADFELHGADPVQEIPPHVVIDERIGPILVFHAPQVEIGQMLDGEGGSRISVRISRPGGSGLPAIGLLATMLPEHAHALARMLVKVAAEAEAKASAAADAAIAKARGK